MYGGIKMKFLLVVDVQNDFILENGALSAGSEAVKAAEVIMEKLKGLEKDTVVWFTKDCHQVSAWEKGSNDIESEKFPPHCIEGTPGFALYQSMDQLVDHAEIHNKTAYSLTTEEFYTLFSQYDFDEIEICGVVTDICVLQNAITIYTAICNILEQNPNRNCPILKIDPKACASFNLEREQFALHYMQDILNFQIEV